MIAFIEKYFKFLAAGVGILVLVLAGMSWLQEHDARLLAEQTVKEVGARVETLEQKVKDVDAAGKARSAAIKKQAARVTTAAQAIPAIPTVTDAPLNARPLPDAPSAVQVEAVPLFQELSRCKAQGVDLDTCSQKAALSQQIIAEKDTEIAALKHPKGFWKRFGTTAKTVGVAGSVAFVVGYAVRH